VNVGTEHEDERHEVRFLIGSGDLEELARRQEAEQADEPQDVTFVVGPPRSTLDIADELEREQAAAQETED
jgi:hypothetical protein